MVEKKPLTEAQRRKYLELSKAILMELNPTLGEERMGFVLLVFPQFQPDCVPNVCTTLKSDTSLLAVLENAAQQKREEIEAKATPEVTVQ